MQKQYKELFLLTLFAVAFGYIEGSVAHYLRMYYYPEGFSFILKSFDSKTLAIESGREFATLLIITSAAILCGGNLIKIFADFVYIFAVWDIVYYLALFLFESWPSTLLDWDILFLIPVPWLAPVLAPIMISILGIAGSLIIRQIYYDKNKITINKQVLFALTAALICWLFSFLINSPVNHPAARFPKHYSWWLFSSGILMSIVGFWVLIIINDSKKIQIE